jgi:predicted DNA-binding transcriptional regulator YafY
MALRSHDRFEVLKAVLAMAEEQGGVSIADAATSLGISRDALLSVLSPMLHISFRAQTDDEMIDTTYAFELDEETDRLSVDQSHWLRDMRSLPPSPATAQRLVLAGLVVKGTSTTPDAALDAALDKLEALSGDLVVVIPEPPCLEAVRDGVEEETTVEFRYAKSASTAVTAREIEPYKVFRQWGSWYVMGKDLGDGAIKYFRIDRMLDAAMSRTRFHPPSDVEVPDRLPVEHLLRHVTVRVPERLRNLLTDDYSIDEIRDVGDGMVEVRVGVLGEERLDHLLLRLGPKAQWLDPALDERRRTVARELLAAYRS